MIPSTGKCRAENEMTVNKGKVPVMLNVESEVKVFIAQLCPTLCDPMDCSLPAFSAHGISQSRILKWVTIPFSKGSSQPRDGTQVSCTEGRFFTIWTTRETFCIPSSVQKCTLYSVQKFHENEIYQDLLPSLYQFLLPFIWENQFLSQICFLEKQYLRSFPKFDFLAPHTPECVGIKNPESSQSGLPEPHCANMQTPLRFVSRTGLCRNISWSSSVLADLSGKLPWNWCVWLIQFLKKGYYRDGKGRSAHLNRDLH